MFTMGVGCESSTASLGDASRSGLETSASCSWRIVFVALSLATSRFLGHELDNPDQCSDRDHRHGDDDAHSGNFDLSVGGGRVHRSRHGQVANNTGWPPESSLGSAPAWHAGCSNGFVVTTRVNSLIATLGSGLIFMDWRSSWRQQLLPVSTSFRLRDREPRSAGARWVFIGVARSPAGCCISR
jgi:hypothetical protein